MARKAAAQVDEEAKPLEQAPVLTEPIEIEVTDDVAEPVAATPAEPVPPKPAEPPAPPVQEDPAIKRRLEEMQRASAEKDKQIAELTRQNNVGRQQYASEQQQRFNAQYDAVINALGAAQSEMASAKQELKVAGAEGDWDAIAEAQEKIGRSAGDIQRLTYQKDQMDNWLEQQKRQPQRPQQLQEQRQPTEAEMRGHAEKAISEFQAPERIKTWFRNHMEYILDPAKNAEVQALHNVAIREGHEQYSEPYIARIEELLGMQPTQKSNGNGAVRQSAPVSAPPTREAPSMTTGRAPMSTKVTLTAEEREVAAMIRESRGITQQEAEQEYAKQKLKMIRDKQQNGGG